MSHLILVLNCGSSSIKFALHETCATGVSREKLWGGKISDIHGASPCYDTTDTPSTPLTLDPDRHYASALEALRTLLTQRMQGRHLAAVAHRVVHGGDKYQTPVRVNAQVLQDLHAYIPLAPLHQPYALLAMAALLESMPHLPQIACFDTAFHHTMPMEEKLLPLDWSHWEKGVRRYGFHGLSYDYMCTALPESHGDRARGRTLVAHIGSGASLCAMRNLQSVATTLGFSALDGLMMGTRCGAIDPGVLLYLMETEQLDASQISQLLYKHSGLLGISGTSDDTQQLLHEEDTNPRARTALALYVRRIAKEISALTVPLGGLDMLVFTAGVGEHNAVIRERVCAQLAWMGMALDPAANARHERVISTPDSRITVAVEPTNEEWIAASHTCRLLQLQSA